MGGTHSDSSDEETQRIMNPYSDRTRGEHTFDTELSPARFWRRLNRYLDD